MKVGGDRRRTLFNSIDPAQWGESRSLCLRMVKKKKREAARSELLTGKKGEVRLLLLEDCREKMPAACVVSAGEREEKGKVIKGGIEQVARKEMEVAA